MPGTLAPLGSLTGLGGAPVRQRCKKSATRAMYPSRSVK